jgi:hypothetical protein
VSRVSADRARGRVRRGGIVVVLHGPGCPRPLVQRGSLAFRERSRRSTGSLSARNRGTGMRRFPAGCGETPYAGRLGVLAGRAGPYRDDTSGAEPIVTVAGELDQFTAERFAACVPEVLDSTPRSVTVAAHGVTFTDSYGLSGLLRARGLAFVDQVDFRLNRPVAPASTARWRVWDRGLALARRVTRGKPGTARRSPARPFPGSSGRLSTGLRRPQETASTPLSVTGRCAGAGAPRNGPDPQAEGS